MLIYAVDDEKLALALAGGGLFRRDGVFPFCDEIGMDCRFPRQHGDGVRKHTVLRLFQPKMTCNPTAPVV